MNIRNLVRTLAVATLLAVTVVSVSAQQADAKPISDKQTEGPVVIGGRNTTCAAEGHLVGDSQHDVVFYSAGARISVWVPSSGSGAFGTIANFVCTSIGGIGVWERV